MLWARSGTHILHPHWSLLSKLKLLKNKIMKAITLSPEQTSVLNSALQSLSAGRGFRFTAGKSYAAVENPEKPGEGEYIVTETVDRKINGKMKKPAVAHIWVQVEGSSTATKVAVDRIAPFSINPEDGRPHGVSLDGTECQPEDLIRALFEGGVAVEESGKTREFAGSGVALEDGAEPKTGYMRWGKSQYPFRETARLVFTKA